jgi:hypothetical protein
VTIVARRPCGLRAPTPPPRASRPINPWIAWRVSGRPVLGESSSGPALASAGGLGPLSPGRGALGVVYGRPMATHPLYLRVRV